ncbi:MAG: ferredoxin, partial [Methanobacteriaceae archaeon]|nr:ferredoxin [Methanobacteriaceae archaeon]
MKKPTFADLSIFFVKHAFHTRFFLAGLTKKSKLAHKVIDKLLFEDDEIIVIPNTLNLNKNTENKTAEIRTKTS